MKFKGLYLTDENEPKFNQPVPLAMVPLIADWKCDLLLDVLGNGIFIGPETTVYPLDAYAYNGTKVPASNHCTFYKELKENLKDYTSECERLDRLPPHHFVWSEDLARAFSELIDLTSSRADAHRFMVRLIWNVDVTPIQEALDRFPDFEKLLDQKAMRRCKKLERYEDICRRRQEIIDSGLSAYKKGSAPNELAIARKISKDLGEGSERHLTKIFSKHCK